MKKYVYLFVISFFVFIGGSKAVSSGGWQFQIGNNLITSVGQGVSYRGTANITFHNVLVDSVPLTNATYAYVFDLCTDGGYTAGTYNITSNGNNYTIIEEVISLYSCSYNGRTGHEFRITLLGPVGAQVGGDGINYSAYNHVVFPNAYSVEEYSAFTSVISYNVYTDTEYETQKKLQGIEDQQKETNEKIDETNKQLGDLNDSLTSEEGADLSGLADSAGWLPAGPIDSILNLPLSLLNNLSTNLNKTCQPVNLPLPYVNKTLSLPCISSIYEQIGNLSAWINTIGAIASAFILFYYLMNLYRWVDDVLTMRENNYIDNWGGI